MCPAPGLVARPSPWLTCTTIEYRRGPTSQCKIFRTPCAFYWYPLRMAQKTMVTVGVPMPRKMRDKLKAAARVQGMPLATWLRHIALKAAGEAGR